MSYYRNVLYKCTLVFMLPLDAVLASQLPHQQPLQPQTAGKPYFDKAFDRFVEDTIVAWHVPGLSIAVIDTGEIYSKGYGYAVLPEGKVTADTQFFTGSTTKAFTAAAVAQLVHDSDRYPDLQWTSPINEFIREDFVLEDEHATSHTTLEDALSHRTGLPRHDLMYGFQNDTPASIVKRMRYLPMTAAPRTTWQYCNLMYVAMTDFLQTVTGMKLETFIHDRFWEPLGMKSTTFSLPSLTGQHGSQLARGYYWADCITEGSLTGRYVPEPYMDLLPTAGAGATISTVNDYALWVRALLDAADLHQPANKSSPITHDMFHDLVTPRSIITGYNGNSEYDFVASAVYSLGWISAKVLNEVIIMHNGVVTGFGAAVYLVPSLNFGIALMGNTAGTSNVAQTIIAARLLVRKMLALEAEEISSVSARVQDSLLALSKLTLPLRSKSNTTFEFHERTMRPESLPLPGIIEDYAGLYSHPAYGVLNVTLSENALEAIVEHTWPYKIQFVHITDTVFEMNAFAPHGLGDLNSKDGSIVWEYQPGARKAVFKFGLDGEVVETMGIEVEDSMVEVARKKGPRYWKEGMMWFRKV